MGNPKSMTSSTVLPPRFLLVHSFPTEPCHILQVGTSTHLGLVKPRQKSHKNQAKSKTEGHLLIYNHNECSQNWVLMWFRGMLYWRKLANFKNHNLVHLILMLTSVCHTDYNKSRIFCDIFYHFSSSLTFMDVL